MPTNLPIGFPQPNFPDDWWNQKELINPQFHKMPSLARAYVAYPLAGAALGTAVGGGLGAIASALGLGSAINMIPVGAAAGLGLGLGGGVLAGNEERDNVRRLNLVESADRARKNLTDGDIFTVLKKKYPLQFSLLSFANPSDVRIQNLKAQFEDGKKKIEEARILAALKWFSN
jgi:hypothetical protein